MFASLLGWMNCCSYVNNVRWMFTAQLYQQRMSLCQQSVLVLSVGVLYSTRTHTCACARTQARSLRTNIYTHPNTHMHARTHTFCTRSSVPCTLGSGTFSTCGPKPSTRGLSSWFSFPSSLALGTISASDTCLVDWIEEQTESGSRRGRKENKR